MVVRDFLAKVREQPGLELVYSDSTMCIVRYSGPEGERKVRLGFWAVRRMQWEQIIAAFRIPVRVRP